MKYKDQKIIIHEVSDGLSMVNFDHTIIESTVLFWNTFSLIKEDEFKYFINRVSNFYPLQIVVAGELNEKLFDWMLNVLGAKFEDYDPDDKHIMTWIIDYEPVNMIIDEFITVITPSLWRFDNWNYYQIYLFGDRKSTTEIKENIMQWLSSQKYYSQED